MQRKTKVLLIASSSPHIANHLARVDSGEFEIEIISGNNKFLPEKQKFHAVNFALMRLANWFKTPKAIGQIIDDFEPDVIHVHQANSIGLFTVLANRKRKKPIALTAWGSDILINPKKNFLFKMMVKYILNNVDVITSDSVYMADVINRLRRDTSSEVVICNFGVKEIDVPIEKKKIIYSNRTHNPLYRVDEVLKSFERFLSHSEDSQWHLKIAGRGSETESLKQLSIDLGIADHVTFVGFVDADTNASLYAEATFFISLPNSDATAMSLLEAMYFECVPILSDLPANREWVKTGSNGFIVEDLNSNFISEAVKMNYDQMGVVNKNIVMEKGTVRKSEEMFRGILHKLSKN